MICLYPLVPDGGRGWKSRTQENGPMEEELHVGKKNFSDEIEMTSDIQLCITNLAHMFLYET